MPIELIEKGYVEDDIVYIMENAFVEFGLPGVSRKKFMNVSVEIIESPKIVKKEVESAESKAYIKDKIQSYRREKTKKGNPFGCCFQDPAEAGDPGRYERLVTVGDFGTRKPS